MNRFYEATHRLKKGWRFPGNSKEIFLKGTPVRILKNKNVLMLDRNGRLRKIGNNIVPAYYLDFFKPRKDFFEKI